MPDGHEGPRMKTLDMHTHFFAMGVGHYGIFNGRKWREQIMPRVRDFIRDNDAH